MSKSARPIRIGKLRSGGQRPWQVKLYGPTSGRSHPRVFFRDPTTGAWRNLVAKDLDDANRIFNETEEWLDAASGVQTSDTELVPANLRDMTALAARLLRRTRDDGVRRRTFEKYESVLRCHILPVIGTTLVSDWDEEHCRDILRRSRNAGLAPDTVQDHGAVLVALVKEAHRRPRWLARDTDPMEGVRYRARARHQGQASFFIPPSHRPETAAVHALCIELWHRGRHQGRPWYCAMGQIAGFLGLRWSEIIALRPIDYDSDRRVIIVSSSIEQSRAGFHREDTKSGKIREVPVTGAVHRWLVRRSRAVLSLDRAPAGPWKLSGPDGLLFPGPHGHPWDRSVWRKSAFTPAARDAGWVIDGDQLTATGLPRGGSPKLPWRNLRHHAATWLHKDVGLPWEEVSHILGHHSVAFTLATYVRRGADSEAETLRRMRPF